MPMKKHEMIYVFYRKLPMYDVSSHSHKFLKEDTPLPTKNKILPVPQLVGCEGKVVRKKPEKYDPPLPNTVIKTELYSNKDKDVPNSLLEIKSQKGKHATQKPIELVEWCLKYYSKKGDLVLDPTMGSGSTGVACKNMERKFIGIELNKDIFKIANDRLNE